MGWETRLLMPPGKVPVSTGRQGAAGTMWGRIANGQDAGAMIRAE